MTAIQKIKFGRLHAKDDRDKLFLVKPLLPTAPIHIQRYWNDKRWWGDQGKTPQCVGYAWTHWLEDGPVVPKTRVHPAVAPSKIYKLAQTLDEFPGEDYDGTTVRAGAKAIQQLGYIKNYLWATTLDEIVRTVLDIGPVVFGTNWYTGMDKPLKDGTIRAEGEIRGGHAYELNGASLAAKRFRIKNSWGLGWGLSGHAYLSFDDVEKLLKEDGEACLAVEIGVKDKTR